MQHRIRQIAPAQCPSVASFFPWPETGKRPPKVHRSFLIKWAAYGIAAHLFIIGHDTLDNKLLLQTASPVSLRPAPGDRSNWWRKIGCLCDFQEPERAEILSQPPFCQPGPCLRRQFSLRIRRKYSNTLGRLCRGREATALPLKILCGW